MFVGNSAHGPFWPGAAAGSQSRVADKPAPITPQAVQRKDACSGSDSQNTQPGVSVARNRNVHAQVSALILYRMEYIGATKPQKLEERDCTPVQREGYHPGLKDFQSILSSFTQYSRLRVVAEHRHGDLFKLAILYLGVAGTGVAAIVLIVGLAFAVFTQ
ncbi:hypothetical protein CTI12_AA198640 [Artemisia annua]|uniref:Uncharacterized protein n=1 Tax=Artemisia annua TaxID=35608 RepID=A0A2U1NYP4_ARTAN|nr:hypothetical protein CTI12_AA198640 [Artemisia annua]